MIKRVKFLMIAFLTFCMLVAICHFLLKPENTREIIKLDDNWTVEHDNDI